MVEEIDPFGLADETSSLGRKLEEDRCREHEVDEASTKSKSTLRRQHQYGHKGLGRKFRQRARPESGGVTGGRTFDRAMCGNDFQAAGQGTLQCTG